MKCLIADDEPLILKDIKRTAGKVLGNGAEIFTAENSNEALQIFKDEDIKIAFLDIEMPYINGLEVAKKILDIRPKTNIIFVTGHGKYALDVLEMYVSGFIMKPVNEKSMRKAIDNLKYPVGQIRVKCFGHFEVFADGAPITFKRTLCKEMLAYLIDKKGAEVSEDEIRFILWDEDVDTEKKRRYVRNIASDIRIAFKTYDMENAIRNNNKGYYSIDTELLSCDYYDYLSSIIEKPNGSYMEQYVWAEETRAELNTKKS